jgi:general secretion pathway protein C
MDVAKRLAEWREQPPEQWLSTVNRYLPPGVAAVLVIGIAYQLATLTWTLAPGGAPTSAPRGAPAAPQDAVIERSSDFDILVKSHLFGVTAKQDVAPVLEAVVDAPDTTLSLTLTGILALGGEGEGQAIISGSRSQEKKYQVGEAIDNTDGATLHSVYVDRVLLNRNGRLETLRLPKEQQASTTPSRSPGPMGLATPAAGGSSGSLRQVISQNASRLTDVVRLAPHVQEGQVVGFRVNPGRDRATFEALGLQAGDVVTDINGTVLNDPAQGLQVFESLGESTQANVTVLRDGVPQVLVIDTTQLQNLQENRE